MAVRGAGGGAVGSGQHNKDDGGGVRLEGGYGGGGWERRQCGEAPLATGGGRGGVEGTRDVDGGRWSGGRRRWSRGSHSPEVEKIDAALDRR